MSKKIKNKQNKSKKGLGIFINPRSDFGFKRVFNNMRQMISFLNNVIFKDISGYDVETLIFLPTEHFGETNIEHMIIADIRCKIQTLEDILVEMQNALSKNFAERLLFYSTYLIRNQAPKRRTKEQDKKQEKPWHYDLKAVYIIAIVNFPMIKPKGQVISWAKLMDKNTNKVFSDKLNFIIVDLTKFNKKEDGLETPEDFWLYTLKYAEALSECPEKIKQDETFNELYDILRTNKLTQEEMEAYNNSVLTMDNLSFFTDYARDEGEKKGEKRGEKRGEEKKLIQIIFDAFDRGRSIEVIADIVNLTVDQVHTILQNRKDGK
ncbi:MAG: Rpn family recombination-promoting nuclease/putative transposase [Prevotellaceae bacterium]|jgi:predicted transposase/invertase (TIGR01784 family)|nr:Rpn family recombination-promoting nuclease/putative transposase [Prevotellaceae bacterium]